MPKVMSQRDQRQDITAEDTFGRVWCYAMEKETMEPTGLVSPGNWTDPMATPAKYLSVPPGKYGQKQLGKIEVDWQRWEKDQRAGLEVWRSGLFKIWKEVKTGIPYSLAAAENDPDIQQHAGVGPWPSAEAIRYAYTKTDFTAASLRGQHLTRIEYTERPGKSSMVNVLTDEAKAMLGISGSWMDEAPETAATLNYHGYVKARCAEGMPLKDAQDAWRKLKASLTPVAA